MRPPILLLVSLLAPTDPASAQVTVDLHALDALPNARPAVTRPAGPVAPPARRHGQVASATAAPTSTAAPSAKSASAGTAASATRTPASAAAVPAANLPTGTPPGPPPSSLQASAGPPDAPQITDPTAPMTAAAVRVMFDASQTDLNANGADIIKQLVGGAPPGDNTTFNVVAYATATPEDPSSARRLSLSRALAVRNALMADGVPSSRIYVRALGGQSGDGPADRADVSVLGSNAPGTGPAKPQ
ncbi:MAG: OmpA family protein [Acetobacteraceae bacterium]|nr:OmpA family protein [Acetobacteraceae bacterium]